MSARTQTLAPASTFDVLTVMSGLAAFSVSIEICREKGRNISMCVCVLVYGICVHGCVHVCVCSMYVWMCLCQDWRG